MDFVIGTLVQRLKAANRYESSLIILMADHAWRQDPLIGTENRAEHLCLIPLCIKLPEQLMQRTLDSRFSTADLGEVLDAYMDKTLTETNAADFLDQPKFTSFSLPELISSEDLLKLQVGFF